MNKCLLTVLLFFVYDTHGQQSPDSSSREVYLRRHLTDEDHLFLSGSYGVGLRLAQLPADLNRVERDYYRKLKRGTFYQLDAAFFFEGGFGVGLVYNSMNADNKIDHVTITLNNGITKTGTVADDITISYFAPQGYYRHWDEFRNSFLNINFGIGYMSYVNNAIAVDPYKVYGNTVGLNAGFSYFIKISPGIWLGPYLSYMAGFLIKYTVDDGVTKQTYTLNESEMEGLHHVDFSIKAAVTF